MPEYTFALPQIEIPQGFRCSEIYHSSECYRIFKAKSEEKKIDLLSQSFDHFINAQHLIRSAQWEYVRIVGGHLVRRMNFQLKNWFR